MFGIQDPAVLLQELDKHSRFQKLAKLDSTSKEQNDAEQWREWTQLYAERLTAEHESSAEQSVAGSNRRRQELMDSINPRIVLRNYIAQNAITKAEEGDFSEVKRVLAALEHPYGQYLAAASLFLILTCP